MDNSLQKTQGIILSKTPFEDKKNIIKVFTKDHGLLTFIVKKSSKNRFMYDSFTSIFNTIECIFPYKNKNIHTLYDVSLISEPLDIRNSLQSLQTAASLCNFLLKTHLGEKPSPLTFDLLSFYLKQIPYSQKHKLLKQSFQLKILTLEGLIHVDSKCHHCDQQTQYYSKNHFYCSKHKPLNSLLLEKNTINCLLIMTYTKSFHDLNQIELTEEEIAIIDTIIENGLKE
ncbi:MAG TPA: DNA repair protein RecO [Chlamydiales bacterium]|nr:DNA repair protein RecO [Chlamydiales bacterium]